MQHAQSLLEEIRDGLGALSPDALKAVQEETLEITKGKAFIPSPGPQTAAYFCKADILLFGGNPGGGKALALDTMLATPDGWTTMRDVVVGDTLFDERGKPTKVTAITPVMLGHKCLRVTFSDGSHIVADADHQWQTQTRHDRDRELRSTDAWRAARRAKRPSRGSGKKPWLADLNSNRDYDVPHGPFHGVLTTKDIADTLLADGSRKNHSIALSAAIDCPEKTFDIDPYVLGAWLGDGTSANGGFTSDDTEIVDEIRRRGYEVRKRAAKYSYGIIGLLHKLRALVLIQNKHIPQCYFRGSIEQRCDLLRGLMDTDGYADQRGQCEFTTTRNMLAVGFLDLVLSLGLKATICEGRAMLNGRDCGPKYRIKFLAPFPAFVLSRKVARQKIDGFRGTAERRYIVAVDEVDSVPVKCVEVDSPSHLYLAGREMIPTHNSALGLGLGLNEHHRSLVVRKSFSDLEGLMDNAKKLTGTDIGFVGGARPKYRKKDGGVIHFAGVAADGSIGGHQGVDHDLLYIDEAAQFPESQIRLLMGWVRTEREGQRCRTVLGSNPPLDSTGDWMIQYFAPWLDETHHNPAEPGELRYFLHDEDGHDYECDEGDFIMLGDRKVYAQSRTFIPSTHEDNPYYDSDEYAKTLAGLPAEVREILATGNFMLARKDDLWQTIPTAWIRAAQDRWTTQRPEDVPMCALSVDVAQGGADNTVLAPRYDGYYPELIVKSGRETPHGKEVAGLIVAERTDDAIVIIDMGGGYGGSAYDILKENGIKVRGHKGSEASLARTKDRQLAFYNKRAEVYWKFREALDPSQDGGSHIKLPPDPEIISDLSAPTYEITSRGIKLETKEKLVKRLGRSPDKGDAIVNAWSSGDKVWNHQGGKFRKKQRPKVHLGHANMKKRRK